MSAFNDRLRVKTLLGLPLVAVAAGVAAFALTVLIWLLPWGVLSVVLLVAIAGCVLLAAVALALGEEGPLLPVRIADARERRRRAQARKGWDT